MYGMQERQYRSEGILIEPFTLLNIIIWLEQQPEGRMFTPKNPSRCLVNQYVADCLGLDKSCVNTGRSDSYTILGNPIERTFPHTPEVAQLICAFDQATPSHVNRPVSAPDALRLARAVLEDCLQASVATDELLDLSVPLLLPTQEMYT